MLIELVVVMSLISLFLYAVIPRVVIGNGEDSARAALTTVAQKARELKHLSFTQGRVYAMRIDLDRQRIDVWESGTNGWNAAPASSLTLPEALDLVEVTAPGSESVTAGTIVIQFYPAGVNDMAILHFKVDGTETAFIRVEPFLPEVVIPEANEPVTS